MTPQGLGGTRRDRGPFSRSQHDSILGFSKLPGTVSKSLEIITDNGLEETDSNDEGNHVTVPQSLTLQVQERRSCGESSWLTVR